MELKKNYTSPRWSMELLDCSMPMSFDTYSRCSYGCLYCFSFFQKSHTVEGYLDGKVRSVNPDKVIHLFECIQGGGIRQTQQHGKAVHPLRARRQNHAVGRAC